MEFKFNHEVVVNALDELNKVKGIDPAFISGEATEEVIRLLKLDECKDAEELRAIRNSIVMIYGSFTSLFYPEIGKSNFEAFDEVNMRMSAFVGVIDGQMISRFGTF